MARDKIEEQKQGGTQDMEGPRVWTPLDVLNSDAYAKLSFSARSLMTELNGQLRSNRGKIYNNGDLTTALSVLKKRGWKDAKTIRKAAKELEVSGFVIKTRQGCRPNKATLYALLWLSLNESPKLDITAKGYPMFAYRRHNKLVLLKTKCDEEKIAYQNDDRLKKSTS